MAISDGAEYASLGCGLGGAVDDLPWQFLKPSQARLAEMIRCWSQRIWLSTFGSGGSRIALSLFSPVVVVRTKIAVDG